MFFFRSHIYERNWARQKVFLDAAHAAGLYVLVDIGADPLASCISGWEKGHAGAGTPDKPGFRCWVNGKQTTVLSTF